jgi:hypothetical protein
LEVQYQHVQQRPARSRDITLTLSQPMYYIRRSLLHGSTLIQPANDPFYNGTPFPALAFTSIYMEKDQNLLAPCISLLRITGAPSSTHKGQAYPHPTKRSSIQSEHARLGASWTPLKFSSTRGKILIKINF